MTTALVLSGGGAKGSFEAGVLQFMFRFPFHPDVICSTSVGSVNGLKLAEGEDPANPNRGFQGLQQIWLSLMSNDQMFQEDPWIQEQPDWIRQKIEQGLADATSDPLDWMPAWLHRFVLEWIIPYAAGDKLSDLQDFVKTAQVAKAIYNLQPIQDLAINSPQRVDRAALTTSNIRLRMATVGLQSGTLQYVTELGRLVNDPALASDDAGSPQVDVITGMLASAAIPVIFEPQQMAGDWYVDGGVRQVAPVAAAVKMGATVIYAVVAPVAAQPQPDYTGKGLFDIFDRALDILTDQITTDNLCPFGCPCAPGCPCVPTLSMRPNVEVEPTTTIDPGLIRINMAYGFMRAHDVLSQQLDPRVREALVSLSDQIASTRKQIWNIENDMQGIANDAYGLASPAQVNRFIGDVPSLRALKNSLMGLVGCRLGLAGPDSMPPDALLWGTSWEAHAWTFFPGAEHQLPNSPWDEFDLKNFTGSLVVRVSIASPDPTPPPGGCPAFPRGSAPGGNYIRDDFGNNDIIVQQGARLAHYWRDNSDPNNLRWHYGSDLPIPTGPVSGFPVPASVSFFQSNFPSRLFPHGNFEVLVHFNDKQLLFDSQRHVTGITDIEYLSTYSIDFKNAIPTWVGPVDIVLTDGSRIEHVVSKPAMIQSAWGNFELIVPQMGPNGQQRLAHYWRDNRDLNNPVWNHGLPNIPFPPSADPTALVVEGIAFFQSNIVRSGPNNAGNFDVLVHFHDKVLEHVSGADYLATYSFDWGRQAWLGPTIVVANGVTVTDVTGIPTSLEGRDGRYYIVVRHSEGNRITLYTSDPTTSYTNRPWYHGTDFLPDVGTCDSISLFAPPTFEAGGSRQGDALLELLAHVNVLRPEGGGHGGGIQTFDFLETSHYDVSHSIPPLPETWSQATTIIADGHTVDGVASF